jgi:hypothetical protein
MIMMMVKVIITDITMNIVIKILNIKHPINNNISPIITI